MRRLDLVDLQQESFLTFSGLFCAHLINLICKLEHSLSVVGFQLFFAVSKIFHLLLESIYFKSQLTYLCFVLQGDNLLIGLGFFLAHIGVHQFLV